MIGLFATEVEFGALSYYNGKPHPKDTKFPIAGLKLGTVVRGLPNGVHASFGWGHIVGFGENPQAELLLQVKFQNSETVIATHPANLEMFV